MVISKIFKLKNFRKIAIPFVEWKLSRTRIFSDSEILHAENDKP